MKKGFSSHAAECHVCVSQVLSAFLWHDSGAARKDILYGLKIKFARTSPFHLPIPVRQALKNREE